MSEFKYAIGRIRAIDYYMGQLELKKLTDFLAPQDPIIAAYWARYDFENIKILLKAKLKNLNPPPLYQCGNIPDRNLQEYILKGANTVDLKIKELINAAQKVYLGTRDFIKMFEFLDKNYLDYYNKTVPPIPRNAKYFASGIIPIVSFLIAKEKEIKKMNLILECKKNHIPSSKIAERLNVTIQVHPTLKCGEYYHSPNNSSYFSMGISNGLNSYG